MNKYTENLIKVRKILGSYKAVGQACGGISDTAVKRWRNQGKPPRTEYTGETNYAKMLEIATNGQVKADDLKPYLIQNQNAA